MDNDSVTRLKVGSIVVLNSGGPHMCVTGWERETNTIAEANALTKNDPAVLIGVECDEISVSCVWLTESGEHQSAWFPAPCLRL